VERTASWKECIGKITEGRDRNGHVVAGIDVGSVSSKAVLMTGGNPLTYSILHTRVEGSQSGMRALEAALKNTGIKFGDIHYVVATGYGRVNVIFAHKMVTEITCHAKGARFMWGGKVRTILDMGGQDCKAIRCDEEGRVISFAMNDRCAAGTGRSIEVLSELLSIPIEEMGGISLQGREDHKISSTCVVFAKSEALSLLREGGKKEGVIASYYVAMAERIYELLERVGVERELVLTGGIAKNPGMVGCIEEKVGLSCLPCPSIYDPRIAGALGAAILAQEFLEEK
jgi:bzd-type benzoyl-CoA reductase Q subunit